MQKATTPRKVGLFGLLLLFVTVFAKPFLAFVRGHFMALPLLSAWHRVLLD